MRTLPLAAMLAVTATPALGQSAPTAPAATSAAAIDPFEQAMAARAVADFARRQRDVVAMLTAARMLKEVPIADSGAGGEATFTAAGLFAEARSMASGNATLLTQIAAAEQSTGTRGVLASVFGKGLVRSVQTVDPRTAYRFNLTAAGGTPLRVGAIGDVGTALAMRVQDARGRTVCLDDNADYAPVCQLTPGKSAEYRIDILNKSGARSRAVILSN